MGELSFDMTNGHWYRITGWYGAPVRSVSCRYEVGRPRLYILYSPWAIGELNAGNLTIRSTILRPHRRRFSRC